MKKGQYVLRKTYQKLAAENKRLLSDIRILTDSDWFKHMPEKIFITARWRKRWDTERELVKMIREYAKKNPIKKKLQ